MPELLDSATGYGQRLVPHIVDGEALSNPNRVVYMIPSGAKFSDGFRNVTVKQFADAVNRASFWMEGYIGKSTSFETIGYSGPGDLRYFIFVIAAIKVGYKVRTSPLSSDIDILTTNNSYCSFLLGIAWMAISPSLMQQDVRNGSWPRV